MSDLIHLAYGFKHCATTAWSQASMTCAWHPNAGYGQPSTSGTSPFDCLCSPQPITLAINSLKSCLVSIGISAPQQVAVAAQIFAVACSPVEPVCKTSFAAFMNAGDQCLEDSNLIDCVCKTENKLIVSSFISNCVPFGDYLDNAADSFCSTLTTSTATLLPSTTGSTYSISSSLFQSSGSETAITFTADSPHEQTSVSKTDKMLTTAASPTPLSALTSSSVSDSGTITATAPIPTSTAPTLVSVPTSKSGVSSASSATIIASTVSESLSTIQSPTPTVTQDSPTATSTSTLNLTLSIKSKIQPSSSAATTSFSTKPTTSTASCKATTLGSVTQSILTATEIVSVIPTNTASSSSGPYTTPGTYSTATSSVTRNIPVTTGTIDISPNAADTISGTYEITAGTVGTKTKSFPVIVGTGATVTTLVTTNAAENTCTATQRTATSTSSCTVSKVYPKSSPTISFDTGSSVVVPSIKSASTVKVSGTATPVNVGGPYGPGEQSVVPVIPSGYMAAIDYEQAQVKSGPAKDVSSSRLNAGTGGSPSIAPVMGYKKDKDLYVVSGALKGPSVIQALTALAIILYGIW